jgi:hypothetical protein
VHILYQFAVSGGLFILTLAFGFWLSHLGKPYNGILFNVHKLIALGAVVVTAIQMVKLLRGMETQALVIVLLVGVALCVIALFASGALMSAGKLEYNLMLAIHRVAPFVLVVGLGLVIVLLKSSSS